MCRLFTWETWAHAANLLTAACAELSWSCSAAHQLRQLHPGFSERGIQGTTFSLWRTWQHNHSLHHPAKTCIHAQWAHIFLRTAVLSVHMSVMYKFARRAKPCSMMCSCTHRSMGVRRSHVRQTRARAPTRSTAARSA